MTLLLLGNLLFHRLNHKKLSQNIFMILMSCLVIWLADKDHMPLLLIALLCITILVFCIGKLLLTWNSASPRLPAVLCTILAIIFFLCYFKYSFFQSAINSAWSNISGGLVQLDRHIFFVGISYFSFKFIHVLVDCYNHKIVRLDLLTFLNYTLFFPSFFSGPINLYPTFAHSLDDSSPTPQDYLTGLKRIINGLFKKIVIANNIAPFAIHSLDLSSPDTTAVRAVIGVYAYMLFVYFDFSGYSDMAIGSGRLVGIYLPENFNYPFLQRNLQQFWANWHMSLTTWLTDYIYWPLARKMRHIKILKSMPVTTSNICIIITFMTCGLWHGDGLHFFLWGTYNGIGLAILKTYGQLVNKRFSKSMRFFALKSKSAHLISTLITFQYVAVGFLIFACDFAKICQFWNLLSLN